MYSKNFSFRQTNFINSFQLNRLGKRIFVSAATVIFLSTFSFACGHQSAANQTTENKNAIVENVSEQTANVNKNNSQTETPNQHLAKNDDDWKQFDDAKLGVSFQYPAKLKIERLKNGVRIFHELNFEHSDPCDNSDDVKTLKKFADFDVTISVSSGAQKISVECEKISAPSDSADVDTNAACFATSNLKGEIKRATFQGCGDLTYNFPLPSGKTLVVERNLVALFGSGAIPEEKKRAENLAGAISTEENNRIFFKIISSLKVNQ